MVWSGSGHESAHAGYVAEPHLRELAA